MMKSLEESAEFQRVLRETGAYRTDPARPRSLADRLLGRFDLWFYLKAARFIHTGHRLAKRGGFDTELRAAHALSFLSIVEDCGGTVDISGTEHPVRLGRPAVFVGNHMSIIESFLLPAILLRIARITAVIKESLLRYPFLGSMARAAEPISVSRRDPREDLQTVLSRGASTLAGGRSVVIFPQSTRSAVFDPNTFNSLGVKLAKKAGVPVIPLALKTDFQSNGRIIKDIGALDRSKTVYFRCGAPLTVEGSGKETNQKVVRFIAESLKEWQETDPGSGPLPRDERGTMAARG